jgi:hypothetical protein
MSATKVCNTQLRSHVGSTTHRSHGRRLTRSEMQSAEHWTQRRNCSSHTLGTRNLLLLGPTRAGRLRSVGHGEVHPLPVHVLSRAEQTRYKTASSPRQPRISVHTQFCRPRYSISCIHGLNLWTQGEQIIGDFRTGRATLPGGGL